MITFKAKNILEFQKEFDTNEKCKAYIAVKRWNGEACCPYCGSTKVYKGKTRYKCGEKECGNRFSEITGTIFENTKLPLTSWFYAMYVCLNHKKGISSLQLIRDLGITQKSAWHLLGRIREMVREKAPQMLTGEVQVDETYVGGKSANWHAKKRKAMREAGTGYIHKTPVIGLLQQGGNVIAYKVPKVDGLTLKPIVRGTVTKGAMLMTDGFQAYTGLNAHYQHVIINHQKGEYAVGRFNTNSIEGFWSHLKRGIYGIYHNVSPKHINRYCDEFAFRYNTRKQKDVERFDYAINKAATSRLKYKELTSNL